MDIPVERITEINDKITAKIESVKRRTTTNTVETLRLKLALAELNYENALDERDYLMELEWLPVIEELRCELNEVMRLNARLDYLSHKSAEEILLRLVARLGKGLQRAYDGDTKPRSPSDASANEKGTG